MDDRLVTMQVGGKRDSVQCYEKDGSLFGTL